MACNYSIRLRFSEGLHRYLPQSIHRVGAWDRAHRCFLARQRPKQRHRMPHQNYCGPFPGRLCQEPGTNLRQNLTIATATILRHILNKPDIVLAFFNGEEYILSPSRITVFTASTSSKNVQMTG